jgi:hypothetical protein
MRRGPRTCPGACCLVRCDHGWAVERPLRLARLREEFLHAGLRADSPQRRRLTSKPCRTPGTASPDYGRAAGAHRRGRPAEALRAGWLSVDVRLLRLGSALVGGCRGQAHPRSAGCKEFPRSLHRNGGRQDPSCSGMFAGSAPQSRQCRRAPGRVHSSKQVGARAVPCTALSTRRRSHESTRNSRSTGVARDSGPPRSTGKIALGGEPRTLPGSASSDVDFGDEFDASRTTRSRVGPAAEQGTCPGAC